MGADGRFAPSPTGTLHVGNLRTALLAWLFARAPAARFLVRVEDLDSGRVAAPSFEASSWPTCAALGLDWDGPVVRQSERGERYEEALARLRAAGRSTRAGARAARSARPPRPPTARCPRAPTRAPAAT